MIEWLKRRAEHRPFFYTPHPTPPPDQRITTARVSAGIDGALHVVDRLLGTASAKDAARMMEYLWQPNKQASETASK